MSKKIIPCLVNVLTFQLLTDVQLMSECFLKVFAYYLSLYLYLIYILGPQMLSSKSSSLLKYSCI